MLAVNGIVYTITDVKDLNEWMVTHFSNHPLFERVSEEELVCLNCYFCHCYVQLFFFQASDPIIEKLYASSEEGQKVTRNNGDKFLAVFKRISDPYDNQT